MKEDNEEIGTGGEGVGSQRARSGGDGGAPSDSRDDAARTREAAAADRLRPGGPKVGRRTLPNARTAVRGAGTKTR